MLINLVVVSILVCLLVLKWRRRHFEKLYDQIKLSIPRWPIIGHLHMLLCGEEDKMKNFQILGRKAIQSGGITGFWFAQKLYIVIADSEVADVVMKSCLEKDDIVKCFHLATGDGSIFTSVKKWRPRRKYLAPTFSMKNLNYYVETFSKLSGLIVEKIRKENDARTNTISMGKVYLKYTMNAIFGSIGIPVNAEENESHPFLIALEQVMSAAALRIFQPWLYSDTVYKLLPRYQKLKHHKPVVYGMFHEAIKEKRIEIEKEHANLNKDSPDRNSLKTFIKLMIESPANVSDDAIREECIVIFSAASDTSAVSLGYVTLMLARYPDVQEKAYHELKEVTGDFDRPISADDLHHLKYLDALIRETLRLYPPVPIIARKIDKNIELPSGTVLVPGCGVFIHIWAINRNPKYWGEDAEEFRPERFLETTARHPAAFMSFSYGPRNCLGYQYAMMSIKTVIATILKQYRIVAASEELMNKPLRVKYDLMMRLLDDYPVKFQPRK